MQPNFHTFCTNLNPIFLQFIQAQLDSMKCFSQCIKVSLKNLRVLGFKVVFQGMKIIMVMKDGEKGMTLFHELKLMNA